MIWLAGNGTCQNDLRLMLFEMRATSIAPTLDNANVA